VPVDARERVYAVMMRFMRLDVSTAPEDAGWRVRLSVSLDRRETNELFLAGDTLIAWPTDGMLSSGGSGPFERSSAFLSEIAGRSEGLCLLFETENQAARVAAILTYQIKAVLPQDRQES
jgi:hypothetical protein